MAVVLSEETQPFGPSALIKDLRISPSTGERRLESVYDDDDQLAVEGIQELYQAGVEVSRIQKILSLGMLGVQKQRKIVPTRWSITAVDDTLSKRQLATVKHYPPITNTNSISTITSITSTPPYSLLVIGVQNGLKPGSLDTHGTRPVPRQH